MTIFYDPTGISETALLTAVIASTAGAAVGVAGNALLSGSKGGGGGLPPGTPPASDTSAAEQDAADQASAAEKQAAMTRNGARASLLTPASDATTFASNPVARKTLLGS